MDEGAFVVDFFMPSGTSLEETDRIAQQVDETLLKIPEVVTFTRRTGTELGPVDRDAAEPRRHHGAARRAAASATRSRTSSIATRDALAAAVPEARFEYVQVLQDVLADLAGNPEPIEIRVLGDDPGALETWAAAAGERSRSAPSSSTCSTAARARFRSCGRPSIRTSSRGSGSTPRPSATISTSRSRVARSARSSGPSA